MIIIIMIIIIIIHIYDNDNDDTDNNVKEFFSFLERLVAPVRPQILFSRTLEKLGRTCDKVGCNLEP